MFFSFHYNRDVWHKLLTEWKGVKLVTLPSPKKKSFEAIIHTFRAINEAKRLGADVLHVHAIGPALLVPYAKLLGMKVVFTHHGPGYDRDKWGFAAKTMLKLGERMGKWVNPNCLLYPNVGLLWVCYLTLSRYCPKIIGFPRTSL